MELIVSATTEKVTDGIIVGVEKEGSKVIVVVWWTQEVLVVA